MSNPRADIFDRMAERWDEMPAPPDAGERLARVVRAGDPGPGQIVLDAGSGTGALVPALLNCAPRLIFAADIAPAMLANLKQKFAGNHVAAVVCDAARLPVRSDAFQALFANAILPHLGDKPAALAEFRRAAAPGARLVVSHIAGRERVNAIHASSRDEVLRGDQVPPAEELATMLREAGWLLVESEDSADFYLVVARNQ